MEERIDGCEDGLTDTNGWMDGWMDVSGWMYREKDRWKHGLVGGLVDVGLFIFI